MRQALHPLPGPRRTPRRYGSSSGGCSRRLVPNRLSSPPTAITASAPTGTGRCSNWRLIIAANGAWLAVQAMAHNLARWTARICLGQQIATTKTLRRRVFALAGRLTRSARRLTLHLPQRWPWEAQVRSRPGPAARLAIPCLMAPSATHPPTAQPNVLANSRQSGLRVPLAASSPRYLALTDIRRRSQSLPAATEDRHRPSSTPNRARTIAPCLSSPVLLL